MDVTDIGIPDTDEEADRRVLIVLDTMILILESMKDAVTQHDDMMFLAYAENIHTMGDAFVELSAVRRISRGSMTEREMSDWVAETSRRSNLVSEMTRASVIEQIVR